MNPGRFNREKRLVAKVETEYLMSIFFASHLSNVFVRVTVAYTKEFFETV